MSFLQSLIVYGVAPILSLLIFLIFVHVVFSWLLAFNIINLRNPMVSSLYRAVDQIMRPLIQPIQRVLPSFGGLDFSPIILLFALYWLRDFVVMQKLLPMLG